MSSINYKFVLIGNSGAGKTSFFRKLSTGEFYEKNISTIGVEKKTLELNLDIINDEGKTEKKSFVISLFDTAGQEKFRAITHNYYKGSDGILLIYDIDDKSSFESIEMWIESIRQNMGSNDVSKYAMVLIGNKSDLIEEEIKEREVTEDEAKQICEKYDIIWGGEQSIRSIGFEELRKLFDEYVIKIYKKIGEKKSWKESVKIKNIKKKETKKKGFC